MTQGIMEAIGMNDLISRKQALEEMTFSDGIEKDGVLYVPLRDVNKHIKNLPSVQPEIILCKDCKFFIDHRCYYWRTADDWRETDDFCSNAERKIDGSD